MKVLIADDHRLIIEGVKIKLAELDPGVEAVVVPGGHLVVSLPAPSTGPPAQ